MPSNRPPCPVVVTTVDVAAEVGVGGTGARVAVVELAVVGERTGEVAGGVDAGAHAPSKAITARSRIRIAFCFLMKIWVFVGFI